MFISVTFRILSFRRKNPHRIFRKLPLDNIPHSAKYPIVLNNADDAVSTDNVTLIWQPLVTFAFLPIPNRPHARSLAFLCVMPCSSLKGMTNYHIGQHRATSDYMEPQWST